MIFEIDSAQFTPWRSLAGGAMIGASVAWYLLANGRTAGISGLVDQLVVALVDKKRVDRDPVLVSTFFLIGLLATPLLTRALGAPVSSVIEMTWLTVLSTGFFVGFGTRLAGGCTSGHGVCGLSRFSGRSAIATAVFMGTAIVTVAFERSL